MAGIKGITGKYVRTSEHKRILSEAQKLRYTNGGSHPRGTLGKHWIRSKEANQKVSEARKLFFDNGGVNPKAMLGKKHSEESKAKMRKAQSKENNARWLGGISVGTNEAKYRSFYVRMREVKKKGNGGSHTLVEWDALKKFYNHICLCCKQAEPLIVLTEDHIIPIRLGGTNNIDNIQPLCQSCNSIKWTKVIDYRPEALPAQMNPNAV